MKRRPKNKTRNSEMPASNDAGKQYPTIDQICDEWAGVFEPEFWDEVERARHCYPPPPREEQK